MSYDKIQLQGLGSCKYFPFRRERNTHAKHYLKMNSVVLSAFEVSVHSEWGRTKSLSFGQRTQLDSWVHYPKENSCNIVK